MIDIVKMHKIKIEHQYLKSLHAYGLAYISYLQSIEEVQKSDHGACFCGYPNIVSNCINFKQDRVCENKKCKTWPMNNMYFKALKSFEEAKDIYNRVETLMVNDKTK